LIHLSYFNETGLHRFLEQWY